MKKIAESVSEIIKRILFIGFSIQIILGVIWMCLNVAHPQTFRTEGGFLWKILTCIPHRLSPIMYPVNLIVAVGSYVMLTGLLGKQKLLVRSFMVAALITFPPGMQCHLSLSPYSLVSSLLIAECCMLYKALKEKKYLHYLALGGICWMLAAWLLPEYVVLGGIPVLFCIMTRKIGLYGLLVALSFGGIICGSSQIAGNRVLPNNKDITYAMCSRFAWTNLQRIISELKMGNVVDIENELKDGVPYADAMKTEFLPRVERHLGDETEAVLRIVSKYGWTRSPIKIVKEIGMDAVAYTVQAPLILKQLKGNYYSSFTGRNYERFCEYSPRAAKYDMMYTFRWLCVAYLCLVVFAFCALVTNVKIDETTIYFTLSVLACILLCSVFYAFCGGGIMDYKLTVSGNLYWIFLCLSTLRRKEKEV